MPEHITVAVCCITGSPDVSAGCCALGCTARTCARPCCSALSIGMQVSTYEHGQNRSKPPPWGAQWAGPNPQSTAAEKAKGKSAHQTKDAIWWRQMKQIIWQCTQKGQKALQSQQWHAEACGAPSKHKKLKHRQCITWNQNQGRKASWQNIPEAMCYNKVLILKMTS